MFSNHPKGLFVAFFANMGERFGYYTMISIFMLFLQAKYGLTGSQASNMWGIFLAAVYFTPLLGGIVADKFLGYSKSISIGLIVMFIGYIMLAIPSQMNTGFGLVLAALSVIALGTGLFKGNLQALVGNMYDDPKYSKNRDVAFNIFYMGINIGAMFAPTAADMICNFVLSKQHFFYNAEIPAIAHKFLNGDMSVTSHLCDLAAAQGVHVINPTEFARTYINTLSESYHYAFGIACVSLVISMLVFWLSRKYYRTADMTEKQKAASADFKDQVVELSPEQTKQRMIALGLVFFVVIFFWMAFHQNGSAMTMFARDYTVGMVSRLTNIWFDLVGLLSVFFSALGLYFLIKKDATSKTGVLGVAAAIVFGALAFWRISTYGDMNPFTPQKFQHFNPFFIVALTPIIVSMFTWMGKKNIEPSAPRKIGIGMLITAIGFTVLAIGSYSLLGLSPGEIGEVRAPQAALVSPYWLVSTYFILTIAELFLSPMGISFVSKVAPPKYKGLMQGGWFAATAVGNYSAGFLGSFWNKIPLWSFWAVLVVCCLLSAAFIFSVIKKLENATN